MADKKKKERKNKRGGCVSGGANRPTQSEPKPKTPEELKRKRPPLDRDRPLP